MRSFEPALGKKVVVFVISFLLVVIAGCSAKIGLPITAPSLSQSSHGTTVTLRDVTAPEIKKQLNQIANELSSQAKIPVMVPQYWPPIQYHACLINYHVGQESYNVLISSISDQAPTNNPQLNVSSEVNHMATFDAGRVGVIIQNFIVEQPKNGEPSVIGGYQGLETPDSFYWASGAWECEMQASSESLMDDAQELTSDFKAAGELANLHAKSGKMLVTENGTSIAWESTDEQYRYVFQYQGNIADAIKIVNSVSGVK